MSRPRRIAFLFLACSMVLAPFLSGCGDDDNPTAPPGPTPASGNVNKAPIAGASVTIHQLNADGSINPAVVAGPFTTDAIGNWSGNIPAGATGPFVMVSTGGTYTDEATGIFVTIPGTQEMYGIYQSGACAVTPLSHSTYLATVDLIAGGETLNGAITQATSSSTTPFGFSFTTTTPSDGTAATTNQKKYAALLGGLSVLMDTNAALAPFVSTPRMDLVLALAADMADGKLDGLDLNGAAIQVPTDATGTTFAALPALSAAGLSAWLTAANTYAFSIPALAAITFNVNTAWNPSAGGGGGGGGGSGTLAFSGSATGTGPLGANTTFTPDAAYVYQGTQYVWTDNATGVEITAVTGSGNSIATIYAILPGTPSSVVWSAYDSNGPTGATVSGTDVNFVNSTLTELGGTFTVLIMNGSLTIPTNPPPQP